jgi:Fic family protein
MTRPEQYHRHLTFTYDTKRITPTMWLSLGEAMSKCQHLAGVPLKPAAANRMKAISLIRGVRATTAIEGNTLSEAEVGEIVAKGTAGVPPSQEYMQREIQNVLEAIREIDVALTTGQAIPITVDRLCELNGLVLDGIPVSEEVMPGKLRVHNVTVGTYRAPEASEVPELVERFTRWLRELRGQVTEKSTARERFVNAVLAAILAHLYIAWIHPFGDGNGRVARLVEVQILSESGVIPDVATNLLSDHYNETRSQYYLALDGAQDDPTGFVGYALQGLLDELRNQIATVRGENLAIHWESYVYEIFRGKPSTIARDRQRQLALTMTAEWITANEATELTTAIAKKYGSAGPRMPARDLNDLVKMGLVEKKGRRYRARRSVIEAFIPPTWEERHTGMLF